MKYYLHIFIVSLLFISCSEDDCFYDTSIKMMDCFEQADSLCSVGEFVGAKKILKEIIEMECSEYTPSKPKLTEILRREIFDTLDKTGQYYFDYLFSYLIKLDAIELYCRYETNKDELIGTLKQVFVIAPYLDDVVDDYIKWRSTTNEGFSIYSPYHSKYVYYKTKLGDNIHLRGEYRGIDLFSQKIVSYIYRRKWNIINFLLFESDRKYGYEQTYSYFDSVLDEHGASWQSYTKVLMKSYMSFSGEHKYRYDTQMTYSDFKKIGLHVYEDWFVSMIKPNNAGYLFDENDFPERIVDETNAGFVLEIYNYDDEDAQYIYNPSDLYGIPSKFYATVDSIKLVTLNEERVSSIYFGKGVKYNVDKEDLLIGKPLLCALLYKHNERDFASMLLKNKFCCMQDTIIKEGFCDGLYKRVKSVERLHHDVEERWYDSSGLPATDNEGVHCKRIEYKDSCTIYRYYDEDMLPVKRRYAKYVSIDEGADYYYDWQDNLIKKFDGDIYTYYTFLDSMNISYIVNWENYTTRVVTEYKYWDLATESAETRLAKVEEVYNDVYTNGVQYGNIMERHRLFEDNFYYVGPKGEAIETFGYDNNGVMIIKAYYDPYKRLQKYEQYEYNDDIVIVRHYDYNNVLLRVEERHNGNIKI